MSTIEVKAACTVCGEPSVFYQSHPEADIYRCDKCSHVFSVNVKINSIYSADYFIETHSNWFKNPDFKMYQNIYDFVKDNINDKKTLIDLGCGNGLFLDYIRSKDEKLDLFGVDLSDNKDRNNIKFFKSDIEHFKIDKTFDFVTLLAFVEHVLNLDSLASTLNNVSKKDSSVIILTINEDGILYRTALLLKKFGVNTPFNRLYSAHHVQHFTEKSLIEFMKRAGFEHIKTDHHNIHMKAMDIEGSSPIVKFMFKYGVWATFVLGKLLRRTYLQTAFFRKL